MGDARRPGRTPPRRRRLELAPVRRTRSPRRCNGPCSRRRPPSGRISTAGNAAGPVDRSITGTVDLDALDALLDQRDRTVGEAADHRVRQLVRGLDRRAAERRAALGRLDEQRQPEPLDQASITRRPRPRGTCRPGARPTRACGSRAGDHLLGDRLVERDAGRRRRGADVRHCRPARAPRGARRPRRPRRAAAGSRSPASRRRSHSIRPASTSRTVDLESGVAHRLGHPPPGPQGDVPLVGQPAGQDDHRGLLIGLLVARCESSGHSAQVGLGAFVAPGAGGRVVAPNVSRSSSSASMTAASRRTPSWIRSGVG